MLARKLDYVYFEADCFMQCKNPYIPLDLDNPSMGSLNQKTLRGPGSEERASVKEKQGR